MIVNRLKQFIKKIIFYNKNKIQAHIVTFIDIDALNNHANSKIVELIPQQTSQAYSPSYIIDEIAEEKYEIGTLDSVKFLQISNAIVIGDSNVIVLNEKEAFYNHNTGDNIDYSDGALRDYHSSYSIRKRTKIYYNCSGLEINEAISLCINYSFNYYHFILECLSKFYLIEKTKLPINIPILIDRSAERIPQFKELLTFFNKENRKIIYIDRKRGILVQKLYAFTSIHYLPANYIDFHKISASSVLFNYDVVDYIRKSVIESLGNTATQKGKRIFLSRANYSKRSYNDKEIGDYLSSKGFEITFTEKLTIIEQAKLFRQAELIIGASGAALTNIIFCKKDTKIVVLANQELDLAIFSSIAVHLQLKMYYLSDQCKNKNNIHTSYYISTKKIDQLLTGIL